MPHVDDGRGQHTGEHGARLELRLLEFVLIRAVLREHGRLLIVEELLHSGGARAKREHSEYGNAQLSVRNTLTHYEMNSEKRYRCVIVTFKKSVIYKGFNQTFSFTEKCIVIYSNVLKKRVESKIY